jgi:uncharacterized protein (DUF2126 family)
MELLSISEKTGHSRTGSLCLPGKPPEGTEQDRAGECTGAACTQRRRKRGISLLPKLRERTASCGLLESGLRRQGKRHQGEKLTRGRSLQGY